MTVYACTDSGDLSSPGRNGRASQLTFAPRFNYIGGSSYFGEPINRIRLTARNQTNNEVVGTFVGDVDPNAQSWDIGLDVTLTQSITVVVTVELINVTNGQESVQWSGITAPINVTPASTQQPTTPVTLYQGPPSNLGVTSVVIAPDSAVIEEGMSTTFSATIAGPPGSVAVWSVTDGNIASVDQDGSVAGLRGGVTSVIAVAGPKADTVRVRVAQAVNAVVVAPDSQVVASVGGEVGFSARVLDRRGADIAGSAVTWSVGDTAIARHTGNGRFITKQNGVTQITATSVRRPTVRGTARLIVAQRAARIDVTPAVAALTSIGATQAYSAVVRDGAGAVMTLPVSWRSSNAAVATVDAAGVAAARATGNTEIAAIVGSGPDTIVGRAALQVTQAAARVEITPPGLTLTAIADTFLFVGVVKDANNNALPNARLTWSSANPAVASVDENGRVTAVGNGSARITGSFGQLSAFAQATVDQRTTSVTITPERDTVNAGATRQLAALARDANGNPIANAAFTWRSSDTTVAVVSAAGLVTGRRAGSVTITGSNGGHSATASLVVKAVGPARVVISPDTIRLHALGANGQFSAATFDASNTLLPNVNVTWTALDPQVATVDQTGKVTSVTNGTARVVASVNPADTAVVVVQQTIDHVSVTPAADTVAYGNTVQLGASALDANNVAVAGAVFIWTSSDTTIATVSNTGLVTTRAAGGAIITATAGGRSASANIVVTPRAASRVQIAPDTIRLSALGANGQFTATVFDDLNAVLAGPVTWASLDPAIATVDANGRVTAVTNGTARVVASVNPADTAVVVVQQVATHIVAQPNTVTLTVTDTFVVSALVKDAGGANMTAAVTWHSSADTIVSVNANGKLRALRNGSASITATLGAVTSNPIAVTVNAGNLTLTSLAVTPSPLIEGAPAVITGVVRNTGSAPVGVSTAQIRILDAASGAVLFGTNLPTPSLNAGDTSPVAFQLVVDTLILWPDSVRGEVTLDAANAILEIDESDNVVRSAVYPVALRITSVNIPDSVITFSARNQTRLITAEVRDRNNRVLSGRVIAFESKNATVATVNSAGVITAIGDGSTYIVATGETRRDSVRVDVMQVVAALQVTPTADTIASGSTLQLNAAAQDSNGFAVTVPFAWVSNDTAVATVSSAGLVTAHRVGAATITASSGGQSAGATITVVAGPPSQVTPVSSTEHVAVVDQVINDDLGVRVVDARGNPLTGHAVEWAPADTVDGTITALEPSGMFDGSVIGSFLAPVVSYTNASGIAKARWRLGRKSKQQVVTACVDAHCVTFKANAKPAGAKKKGTQSGNQDIVVKKPGAPVTVQVLDVFDNAVPNAKVAWIRTDSSEAFSPSVSTTDASGLATLTYTARRLKGSYTLKGAVLDSADNPVDTVSFTINAKPDKPSALRSGRKNPEKSKHNFKVATALTDTVEIELQDEYGNTVDNVPVVWRHKRGNGSNITNAGTTSDGNGKVSGHWLLGTKADKHQIQVRAGANADTIVFDLESDTKPAGAKKKGTQSGNQDIVVKKPGAPVTVQVLDVFDNAVPNAKVAWIRTDSSEAFSPSVSTTDASGLATLTYTARRLKGSYTLKGAVLDSADNPVDTVSFTINAKPDKPSALRSGRKNPEKSKNDSTVAVELTDTVAIEFKDEYGNTLENVPITWSKLAGEGSTIGLAGTSTDNDGTVTGRWVLGTKAGSHVIKVLAGTGEDTASIILSNTTKAGPVKKLRFSQTSAQIDALQDSTTLLSAAPADEFDNDVNTSIAWSSSDTTTVRVGANGKVHSKNKNASAKVYGTAGGFTDSVSVTVQQRIKFLELSADTLTALQINKKLRRTQRDRNGQPIDSTFHEALNWTSSDTTVAKVDAGTGVVTSIANGFSTITARAVRDDTVLANVVVEVRQAADLGITLTGDTIVVVGNTIQLTASATDSNNRPVTRWTWSATPIDTGAAVIFGGNAQAQRESTINIIGQQIGRVTVTATDARGSRSASKTITVVTQ